MSADEYIRSIRNSAKREYAIIYRRWLERGCDGPEPDRGSLSYMGAQAVALRLTRSISGNTASIGRDLIAQRDALVLALSRIGDITDDPDVARIVAEALPYRERHA